MSEKRIRKVVSDRLEAFKLVECKLLSVTPDNKGEFDVVLHASPIANKRAGSIATQANAVAVEVISALNTATEADIDCGVVSCHMEALQGSGEGPFTLPLTFKMSVVTPPAEAKQNALAPLAAIESVL